MKQLSVSGHSVADDILCREDESGSMEDSSLEDKKMCDSSRSLLLSSESETNKSESCDDNSIQCSEECDNLQSSGDNLQSSVDSSKWNDNPIYDSSEGKSSDSENCEYKNACVIDRYSLEFCNKDVDVALIERNNYLLTSSNITENRAKDVDRRRKERCFCGPKTHCVTGLLFLFAGIFTCFYTPLEFFLNERLKMIPGLPAFDWWLNPPENVHLNVYLFNVTNHEEFLNGIDTDLKFEEVGPIVYKEMLEHTNITFNENSTLTYTARRWPVFMPELNTHIDLNATLIHPNMALLGLAAYIQDLFPIKMLFNIAVRNSPVFKQESIYNSLWNSTDPILTFIKSYFPALVPTDNLGILDAMYNEFTDEATVFIGPKWGNEKFFTLDKYQGSSTLPGYSPEICKDTFENATEGILYSQRLTNQSRLRYWRKTICRVVDLLYDGERVVNGVTGYQYTLPNNTYYRINDTDSVDCYAGKQELPDGLSDVSMCFANFPVATSLPHFIGVDPKYYKRIKGIKPDNERHMSYALVEPMTGIPLESRAISQSNLIIRPLTRFNKNIMLFSDMILPMFWMEIKEVELPNYIWHLINFCVIYVPTGQIVFSVACILIGVLFLWKFLRAKLHGSKSFYSQQQLDNFTRRKIMKDNSLHLS